MGKTHIYNPQGYNMRNVPSTGYVDPSEDSGRLASLEPWRDAALIETDFAELNDGTLVELVENPTNPSRYCFAVWRGGEIRLEEHSSHGVLQNDQSECILCKTLLSDKEEFQPFPTAIATTVRLD